RFRRVLALSARVHAQFLLLAVQRSGFRAGVPPNCTASRDSPLHLPEAWCGPALLEDAPELSANSVLTTIHALESRRRLPSSLSGKIPLSNTSTASSITTRFPAEVHLPPCRSSELRILMRPPVSRERPTTYS